MLQQELSLDVPATMQKIRSQSGMPAHVGDDHEDVARTLKTETTADLAFRSFWGSDLALVVGKKMNDEGRGSVQNEFMRLQSDSAKQRSSNLQSLADFAGVHFSVRSSPARLASPLRT